MSHPLFVLGNVSYADHATKCLPYQALKGVQLIRIIILILFFYLVWVLFLSGFERRKKIVLELSSIAILIVALWFEGRSDRLYSRLIQPEAVVVCGVESQFSYRTNFDIAVCLENQSTEHHVKRLHLEFVVEDCASKPCTTIQAIENEFAVHITPETTITVEKNMSFVNVEPESESLNWRVNVAGVQASTTH